MTLSRSYVEGIEERIAREESRFARYWDIRMQEPEHPLALLAAAHPELVEAVRQIAYNAFRGGVHFAEFEHKGN